MGWSICLIQWTAGKKNGSIDLWRTRLYDLCQLRHFWSNFQVTDTAFHIGFYLSSLLYLLTASSKLLLNVSLALSRKSRRHFEHWEYKSLLARTTTLKIFFSWGIFNCLRTLYVSSSYFSYVEKTEKRVYCNVIRVSWGNDPSRCAYRSLHCITSVKKVMLLSRAPN